MSEPVQDAAIVSTTGNPSNSVSETPIPVLDNTSDSSPNISDKTALPSNTSKSTLEPSANGTNECAAVPADAIHSESSGLPESMRSSDGDTTEESKRSIPKTTIFSEESTNVSASSSGDNRSSETESQSPSECKVPSSVISSSIETPALDEVSTDEALASDKAVFDALPGNAQKESKEKLSSFDQSCASKLSSATKHDAEVSVAASLVADLPAPMGEGKNPNSFECVSLKSIPAKNQAQATTKAVQNDTRSKVIGSSVAKPSSWIGRESSKNLETSKDASPNLPDKKKTVSVTDESGSIVEKYQVQNVVSEVADNISKTGAKLEGFDRTEIAKDKHRVQDKVIDEESKSSTEFSGLGLELTKHLVKSKGEADNALVCNKSSEENPLKAEESASDLFKLASQNTADTLKNPSVATKTCLLNTGELINSASAIVTKVLPKNISCETGSTKISWISKESEVEIDEQLFLKPEDHWDTSIRKEIEVKNDASAEQEVVIESQPAEKTLESRSGNLKSVEKSEKVCSSHVNSSLGAPKSSAEKSGEANSTQEISENSDLVCAIEAVKVEAEMIKSKQKNEKPSDLQGKEEPDKSIERKTSTEELTPTNEEGVVVPNSKNYNTASIMMSGAAKETNGSPTVEAAISSPNSESIIEASSTSRKEEYTQFLASEVKQCAGKSEAPNKCVIIGKSENSSHLEIKEACDKLTNVPGRNASDGDKYVHTQVVNEKTNKGILNPAARFSSGSENPQDSTKELDVVSGSKQATSLDKPKGSQISPNEIREVVKEASNVESQEEGYSSVKSEDSRASHVPSEQDVKSCVAACKAQVSDKSKNMEASFARLKPALGKSDKDEEVSSSVVESGIAAQKPDAGKSDKDNKTCSIPEKCNSTQDPAPRIQEAVGRPKADGLESSAAEKSDNFHISPASTKQQVEESRAVSQEPCLAEKSGKSHATPSKTSEIVEKFGAANKPLLTAGKAKSYPESSPELNQVIEKCVGESQKLSAAKEYENDEVTTSKLNEHVEKPNVEREGPPTAEKVKEIQMPSSNGSKMKGTVGKPQEYSKSQPASNKPGTAQILSEGKECSVAAASEVEAQKFSDDDESKSAKISLSERDADNSPERESQVLPVKDQSGKVESSVEAKQVIKNSAIRGSSNVPSIADELSVSAIAVRAMKESRKEPPEVGSNLSSVFDKPVSLEKCSSEIKQVTETPSELTSKTPCWTETSQVSIESKHERSKPSGRESITKALPAVDQCKGSEVKPVAAVSEGPSDLEETKATKTDDELKSTDGMVSSGGAKQEAKPGSTVTVGLDKPKTTKVMPSLREIRKIPFKAETSGKSSMSVSIVKRPRLSDPEPGRRTLSASNGKRSVSNPENSTENDPLLNITSECRVELEITKIPANCQLKTEPSGKPVFVLRKDAPGPGPGSSTPKTMTRNFVSNSGAGSRMMSSGRGSRGGRGGRGGLVRVNSADTPILGRPAGAKRGRKRAITIDMTRPSGLHTPVKAFRADPNSKAQARANAAHMQRMFPKSGPSPKTTSALEMLLMNRGVGVSHNPPISDASVANFCQVEQLVSEPDMYSTPITQLKKLSKGPADSILKQIAFGSQQFGAITISPVKPTTPPMLHTRPAQFASTFRGSGRPAQISRSSSIDDVIDSVAAGQGEISPKCLLELNSAGEPKKKRGRPRKVVPNEPLHGQYQPETLQCAPDLFFMSHKKQAVVRATPLKIPTPLASQMAQPLRFPHGLQSPRAPPTPTPHTPQTLQILPTAQPPSTPVPVTPQSPGQSLPEDTSAEREHGESAELKKTPSGRVIRTCTIKEPKKKASLTPKPSEKPRSGKKKKDEEPAEPDPEEEARKQRELEEEAKRKAELKEKRLQEKQKRLELRSKALAEKKAKLKRRAEERKRQYYEKKQRLQEEKAEMERRRALAPPENFSEETQMGDENDSLGELTRNKKGRMEVIDPESSKEFKVHQVAEYQWPLQGGEFFMLQEQISQYLGVKSFKRKYPDITRRTIEAEERTFLCDSGLVSETMCDLGLTALRSADVLDIMFSDFHDKYEEFRQHLRDMQAKEFSLKQLALAGKPTGEQLTSIEKAVQSAARWNSMLNKSRLESRKSCLDLQTFIIQYPRSKLPKAGQQIPKIGNYPISLIPGQFTDYYKPYSAAELRYLPLNTVLYGPIKPYNVVVRESRNDFLSESEDSSSSDGSSCSSSDDSDSGESSKETAMDTEVSGQEGAICKICNGNRNKNKRNVPEVLIHCAQCTGSCHPSCLDLALEMVPHIQRYDWQCTDCKRCARCKEVSDEDKMLFCDLCDRGYHIYCVGLRKVPVGRWHCQECAVCASCAVHEPGPNENALWHHEYKRGGKGGKNTYIRSFCENCAKDQIPVDGNILRRES